MKTHKTNFKAKVKIILFAIFLFAISLAGSTQDSCFLIFDKDMNLRISDNFLALANVPKIEEIYINPGANLFYIEFEETDEELNIENWMSNENFSSETSNFEWDKIESEQELEIEDWMIKENTFGNAEPELEIENWMTESWTN